MQAIRTRFVSRSAFPSEVCIPAVFVCTFNNFFVTVHVFSSKGEVRSKVVACTNVPDFFVAKNIEITFMSAISIIIPVTSIISFIVGYICINCTKVSFNACYIKTVGRSTEIFFGRTFSSDTEYFYVIAVSNFNAIDVGIEYVSSTLPVWVTSSQRPACTSKPPTRPFR